MTITPSDTSFVPRKCPQQVRAQETVNRVRLLPEKSSGKAEHML